MLMLTNKTIPMEVDEEEKTIKLIDLNPFITCKICLGYLIDATTVSECLHTFCKSCLVKHLEENNNCPECRIIIHQSHPLQYINFDRTMQDIVYKVVPKLQENEWKREHDYYKSRGQSCPKNLLIMGTNNTLLTENDIAGNEEERKLNEIDYNRRTEQVNVSLNCKALSGPLKMEQIKRRFFRCSALATILHIKKYIALQLLNTQERFREIEVWCDSNLLPNDLPIKYIYITQWKFHDKPLVLSYQRSRSCV